MMEMVALELGLSPDWKEAEAYIDSLVLEEVGEDLLAECGVDPEVDRRERWLSLVKERLREDLRRFRQDVETDRDELEVWELEDALLFVSVGSAADEGDPDNAHGWMCRLVDSGALAAAGFKRVRKAELYPLSEAESLVTERGE